MKSFSNSITRIIFVGFLLLALAPVSSFSQKWVSTQVQKRNAVLEEFTGVRCVYCPDGHKIANELKAQYPGKVVVVNIHAGSFATPGAGDLDLRTAVSTSIDRAAGVTGYPAGSVNRATNPWAISRNQWAGVVPQILNMNSPVNVAVRSVYDPSIRKIKSDVEIYYTGNPMPGDKINLYILQDSILGQQTGGTNFYPSNFINGQYIHNHALRMSMDGNPWGLAIPNAQQGKLIEMSFITEVPQMIGNVPVSANQLKVVAIVVPANNAPIYTGVEEEITSGTIDQQSLVDLEITDKTTYPTTLQALPMTPQVEVVNNSNKEIKNFDVFVDLNGVTVPKTFTGSLMPGAKTVVAWDPATPRGGVNVINFKGVYNLNDSYLDGTQNAINSVYKGFLAFNEKAFKDTKIGFDGSYPAYVYMDNSQNTAFSMQNSNNPFLGANGTTGAMWFILDAAQVGAIAGKTGYIMLGEGDLTNAATAKLSYYYAYSDGNKNGTAPVVRTEVSTDWGATWQLVNSTTCQKTGEITPGYSWYLPKSSEYILVDVDLADYLNKGVIYRVGVVPGSTGNCMWVDEITIVTTQAASGPNVSVNSKTLTFGTVNTDETKDMDITVSNTGDEALTVYDVVKTDSKGVFSITSGSDIKSIPAGGTAKISVKFAPKAGESYSGQIEITTNGKNEQSTKVMLSGTGNPAGNVAYGSTPNGALTMSMTPNPVVDDAQFNYTISGDANRNVRIYVMDITGKVVSELLNSSLSAGNYNLNFSASKYVSGTYYIMAEVDGSKAQIPVVITK